MTAITVLFNVDVIESSTTIPDNAIEIIKEVDEAQLVKVNIAVKILTPNNFRYMWANSAPSGAISFNDKDGKHMSISKFSNQNFKTVKAVINLKQNIDVQ